MGMQEAVVIGLWTAGPLLSAVLLYEGSAHAATHWPKLGEWCERCRRPMQGDSEIGSICEACEPLGPTRRMRQRAARVAGQSNGEGS